MKKGRKGEITFYKYETEVEKGAIVFQSLIFSFVKSKVNCTEIV